MTRRSVLLLVCAAAALAGAAEVRGQTPFALQNIGQRITSDDARMVARGFGMTVSDSLHPGFKNVASLSSLRHVAIKFTGYGERTDSRDHTGERRTYRAYSPDVRVAVPVIKNRLAVTVGFSVQRSTAWATRADTNFATSDFPFEDFEDWPDTIAIPESFRGDFLFEREGSLFTVPVGAAFQALPGVSLGACLNLVRGSNVDASAYRFWEPPVGNGIERSQFYRNSKIVAEETYNGTSLTWAVLLSPGRRFRLGASWTPSYDVDVARKVEFEWVTARARSTSTMRMPEETRAGCEINVSSRWRLGADGHFAEYSAFRGRQDWEAALKDEYAWSVGFERIRGRERRAGLKNLPFRLSTGYRRWSYTIGNSAIEERTYAVGTGFPLRDELGQLDLALSYSRIGDRGVNGYESDVWRLTVSVTGLEAWW